MCMQSVRMSSLKPRIIETGRVAEGGHERAAGDPPEHDAGAAERGGRHVHLGAAPADLPPTVLRLFQGRGRRRARGEGPLRATATQELKTVTFILFVCSSVLIFTLPYSLSPFWRGSGFLSGYPVNRALSAVGKLSLESEMRLIMCSQHPNKESLVGISLCVYLCRFGSN